MNVSFRSLVMFLLLLVPRVGFAGVEGDMADDVPGKARYIATKLGKIDAVTGEMIQQFPLGPRLPGRMPLGFTYNYQSHDRLQAGYQSPRWGVGGTFKPVVWPGGAITPVGYTVMVDGQTMLFHKHARPDATVAPTETQVHAWMRDRNVDDGMGDLDGAGTFHASVYPTADGTRFLVYSYWNWSSPDGYGGTVSGTGGERLTILEGNTAIWTAVTGDWDLGVTPTGPTHFTDRWGGHVSVTESGGKPGAPLSIRITNETSPTESITATVSFTGTPTMDTASDSIKTVPAQLVVENTMGLPTVTVTGAYANCQRYTFNPPGSTVPPSPTGLWDGGFSPSTVVTRASDGTQTTLKFTPGWEYVIDHPNGLQERFTSGQIHVQKLSYFAFSKQDGSWTGFDPRQDQGNPQQGTGVWKVVTTDGKTGSTVVIRRMDPYWAFNGSTNSVTWGEKGHTTIVATFPSPSPVFGDPYRMVTLTHAAYTGTTDVWGGPSAPAADQRLAYLFATSAILKVEYGYGTDHGDVLPQLAGTSMSASIVNAAGLPKPHVYKTVAYDGWDLRCWANPTGVIQGSVPVNPQPGRTSSYLGDDTFSQPSKVSVAGDPNYSASNDFWGSTRFDAYTDLPAAPPSGTVQPSWLGDLQKLSLPVQRTRTETRHWDSRLMTLVTDVRKEAMAGTQLGTLRQGASGGVDLGSKSYTYDSLGRLASVSGERGAFKAVETFTYQGNSQLISSRTKSVSQGGVALKFSGKVGNTYTYDQSPYQWVSSETDLLTGRTVSFQRDSLGRTVVTTAPDGVTSVQSYDAWGRLLEGKRLAKGQVAGYTLRYAYDERGLWSSQTLIADGRSLTTTTYYDAFGRTVSVVYPDGSYQKTVYDGWGQKLTQTPVLKPGQTVYGLYRWNYDPKGRLVSLYDPKGRRLKYVAKDATWDATAGGSVFVEQNDRGYSRTTVADLIGQRLKLTDEKGQATTYAYDKDGHVVQTRMGPAGAVQTRTYAYNDMGWLVSRTEPEEGTTLYSDFTMQGYPQTVTQQGRNGAGRSVTAVAFDAQGRSTAISVTVDGATSLQRTLSYDPVTSQVANFWETQAFTDPGGKVITSSLTESYGYDDLGRMVSKTMADDLGQAFTVSRTLDSLGNTLALTYPAGGGKAARTKTIQYDRYLRPTDVTFGVKRGHVDYDLVSGSSVSSVLTYGNGVRTTSRMDLGELVQVVHSTASGVLEDNALSWTAGGLLLKRGQDQYDYDEVNRLKYAKVTGLGGEIVTQQFTYDAYGNRAGVSAAGGGGLGIGEILSYTVAASPATNDLPASVSSPAGPLLTGAQYDNYGRLQQVWAIPGNSASQVSWVYDGAGRVVMENGVRFLLDGSGLRFRRTQGNGAVQYTVYGFNRDPLSVFEKAAPQAAAPRAGASLRRAATADAGKRTIMIIDPGDGGGGGGGGGGGISDTIPPSISVTESGTSGTITFTGLATDNVGVASVEFYVDGVFKVSRSSAPFSVAVDSKTIANGTHALVGKAYDTSGNAATSAAFSFSVSNPLPDTQAPSVTAAETGTSGNITLSATASDNVGVTKVELYLDGFLAQTLTAAPYSVTYDSYRLANGSHTLYAKAYDAAGNAGTSTAVSFGVTNGPKMSLTVSNLVLTASWGPLGPSAAKVEFLIDNVVRDTETIPMGPTTSCSYVINDPYDYTNGPHTVRVRGTDASGNVGTVLGTVTISNNLTVSASVAGSAGAIQFTVSSSEQGTSSYELLVDGQTFMTLPVTADPYSTSTKVVTADSTTFTNGSHTFQAKSYDPGGNVGQSPGVPFTVANGAAVALLASQDNGRLNLSATAAEVTKVARVEFYLDATFLGATTTYPHQLTADSSAFADGPHKLSAKAVYADGHTATSGATDLVLANGIQVTAAVSGAREYILLSATPATPASVTQVDFFIDGSLAGTAYASPFVLRYDSSTLADGTHALVAKAWSGGKATSSRLVNFLTRNGDRLALSVQGQNGTLVLSAVPAGTASIQRVELYVDSLRVATPAAAPYSTALDASTYANGQHNFRAVAYTDLGQFESETTFKVAQVYTLDSLAVKGERGTLTLNVAVKSTAPVSRIDFAWLDSTPTGSVFASVTGLPGVGSYQVAVDTTGLPDGTRWLICRVYDAWSQQVASAQQQITLKSTAGTTDATLPVGGLTYGADAAPKGTPGHVCSRLWDNVGVSRLDVYVDGALVGSATQFPFSVDFPTSGLAVGGHTVTGKAYDAAGNVAALASSGQYFVQQVLPTDGVAPTIALAAPRAGTGKVQTLLARAQDETAFDRISFYVDGNWVGDSRSTMTLSSWDPTVYYFLSLDTSRFARGTHALTAEAYDMAGNKGTAVPMSFTVDNGPDPDAVLPTAVAGTSGTSGMVTLFASGWDNAGVKRGEVYVDQILMQKLDAAPYVYAFDSRQLANGAHAVVWKLYDESGNVGISNTASLTVSNTTGTDTFAPRVTASESGARGTVTLAAVATDNVGVTKVELYVDGVLKSTLAAAPYTASLDSRTIPNGSNTLWAKAYDAAGNVTMSPVVTFTVDNTADTTAPVVRLDGSLLGTRLTATATTADATGILGVDFYLDGQLKLHAPTAPYALSLDVSSLADGPHTLVAKATDGVGNVGVSDAVYFTTKPVIQAQAKVDLSTVAVSGVYTFTTSVSLGQVTKVEYYLDGTLVGSSTAAPSFTSTLAAGSVALGAHALCAMAYDAKGHTGTTPEVNFAGITALPLTWKSDRVHGFGLLISEDRADVGTVYIQGDQVGSPSYVTDGSGTVIGRTKGMPFGERLGQTGTASLDRFAGHEEGPGSAVYMQARTYLPAYGRFAQPDPLYAQHVNDPQTWNLYRYTRNNPVSRVDSTGLDDGDDGDDGEDSGDDDWSWIDGTGITFVDPGADVPSVQFTLLDTSVWILVSADDLQSLMQPGAVGADSPYHIRYDGVDYGAPVRYRNVEPSAVVEVLSDSEFNSAPNLGGASGAGALAVNDWIAREVYVNKCSNIGTLVSDIQDVEEAARRAVALRNDYLQVVRNEYTSTAGTRLAETMKSDGLPYEYFKAKGKTDLAIIESSMTPNQTVTDSVRGAGVIGHALLIGGVAVSVKNVMDAPDGQKLRQMGRESSRFVGGVAGAEYGAVIGGMLGTFIPIPGVGTMVGAWAGSFVGGYIGSVVGENLFDAVNDGINGP